MNKYPKQLTREEGLELRKMRKDAGIPIPKIAEYMHTYPSKISDLERGKKRSWPWFSREVKETLQVNNTI